MLKWCIWFFFYLCTLNRHEIVLQLNKIWNGRCFNVYIFYEQKKIQISAISWLVGLKEFVWFKVFSIDGTVFFEKKKCFFLQFYLVFISIDILKYSSSPHPHIVCMKLFRQFVLSILLDEKTTFSNDNLETLVKIRKRCCNQWHTY